MAFERLLTAMHDPAVVRVAPAQGAAEPAPAAVRVAVRRVALTTNNVTYALFGERMQYWQFFPTGEAGWGLVPAWGFADVVASRVPELAVGERLYGYWPLASQVDLQPAKVSPFAFTDATAHRAALPAAYNRYQRCAADPGYRAGDESALALLRPLFGTAFLLADFLHEQGWFGARRVVLSSASSKTAMGTAWCLREIGGVEIVALTSATHEVFVRGLGVYDAVQRYDATEALDAAQPTVFADFSGDAAQRARLHRHLGAALVHSAVIGATQYSEGPRGESLPGPKPTFFFAPEQMRVRSQAWGSAELQRRVGDAQQRFAQRAFDAQPPWLRIVEHRGLPAAAELMQAMARGQVDPALGHVLVLG
ncbi:MAG: DUF2855 family protein [Nitrospira sp.]|nr:DUF2855 family protein [Nitrospira sp.]